MHLLSSGHDNLYFVLHIDPQESLLLIFSTSTKSRHAQSWKRRTYTHVSSPHINPRGKEGAYFFRRMAWTEMKPVVSWGAKLPISSMELSDMS